MSVSTHRWRPDIKVKSGYYNIKRHRKLNHSKKPEKCQVTVKFENSSYFNGSKFPNQSIYKESKGNIKVVSTMLESKNSDYSLDTTIEVKLTKKLYASEYVESHSVGGLLKLKDPTVRFYVLMDKDITKEESIQIMEIVKYNFSSNDWYHMRLIMIGKSYDIPNGVLRKTPAPKSSAKPQTIPEGFSLDDVEDIMAKEDDYTQSDEARTNPVSEIEETKSGATLDEEQEEKILNKMNMKYRDSRIITTNRKQQSLNPAIDPVEKCFLAITKMLEDNLFSAAKGLNEVNNEIDIMMDTQFIN